MEYFKLELLASLNQHNRLMLFFFMVNALIVELKVFHKTLCEDKMFVYWQFVWWVSKALTFTSLTLKINFISTSKALELQFCYEDFRFIINLSVYSCLFSNHVFLYLPPKLHNY